jgi:hypothetical protein
MEKKIEWQTRPMLGRRLRDMKRARGNGQINPRRYDVEVIGFDNGSVGGLTDRQGGVGSEKIHHHALMRRIEVLDKHERHVAMCGQCRKEPFASLKPPGRGTDANDKEIL